MGITGDSAIYLWYLIHLLTILPVVSGEIPVMIHLFFTRFQRSFTIHAFLSQPTYGTYKKVDLYYVVGLRKKALIKSVLTFQFMLNKHRDHEKSVMPHSRVEIIRHNRSLPFGQI